MPLKQTEHKLSLQNKTCECMIWSKSKASNEYIHYKRLLIDHYTFNSVASSKVVGYVNIQMHTWELLPKLNIDMVILYAKIYVTFFLFILIEAPHPMVHD